MEIRQLRYFLKIAELGSFSRASQVLHIAQPALSQQIAQLEAELGHALLHRLRTGVQPTEQGLAFYSHAQRILKLIDDSGNVVGAPQGQLRGTVSVGLPQSTTAMYAMPLLQAVAQHHPGIELELFDEISGNLLRGVDSGRLDIAVMVNDPDAALLDAVPLLDEELFFVSGGANAPAARKDAMPVAQLAQLPLALPGMHHGVRGLVEDAVRAAGATLPRPAVVANSMSIMRRAVEEGGASSVMPWGAVCDGIRAGTIRALPLAPRLSRRVHVCCARGAQLSLAGQAVRDLLVRITRERVQSGEWQGVRLL